MNTNMMEPGAGSGPAPHSGEGSSLVLVLIGVLVIAGVALVLIPIRPRSREQAGRAQAMSCLKQVGIALNMYAEDHGGEFPPDLATLADDGYVTDPRIFVSQRGPYAFRYMRPTGEGAAGETVVAAELVPPGEGCNVLYADGHVSWETGPWKGGVPATRGR